MHNEKRLLSGVCSSLLVLLMISNSPISLPSLFANTEPAASYWSKTYGSGSAYDIISTSDGGYAAIGTCGTSGGHYWLVKLDAEGNAQWNQSMNSPINAFPKSVVQTSDDGYIVVGTCRYAEGTSYYGILMVKIDAQGSIQWKKTYGDIYGVSEANCVIQTSDGGYAIAGDYASYTELRGWEFLFIKTDSEGNQQWSKTLSGHIQDDDRAECIIQTNDGGYALVGTTSIPGNTPQFCLIKTDSAGNEEWSKSYTESIWNWPYSVVQTSDGGYALVGLASSEIGGTGSFWLVKTDSDGNMQWNRNFGNNTSWVSSIIQTRDGGYAMVGNGGSFQLVKTDDSGNLQWTYGGTGIGNAVIEVKDGDLLIAGKYNAEDNGYFWVAKTASDGTNSSSQTDTHSSTPTNSSSQQNILKLDLSCQSSTTYSALKVNINGKLSYGELGLVGLPVLLSYSVNNGVSWIDLTTVLTDELGDFTAFWTPSVTGNYLIKAVWTGNAIYPKTNTTVSLNISPCSEQSIFSVASNSTLSGLRFDSATKQLSFSVTGPTGSTGYIDVSIPKSLISDASKIEIDIDGNQTTYSSQLQGDSWLISFNYHHSTHEVNIDLNPQTTDITQSPWLIYVAIALIVVISLTAGYLSAIRKTKTSR